MLMQLILILAMACFGLGILLLLKPRFSVYEMLGLSFPIGSFITTFLWFLLSWKFGIAINSTLGFFSIAIGVVTLLLSVVIVKPPLIKSIQISTIPRSVLFMGALIGILILETFVSNSIKPINDWDSMTLYDFRALRVTQSQTVMDETITKAYFLGYPFYTTMGHVTAYIFNSHEAKIWYTFIYISLILTFFGILRRKLGLTTSALGALIFAAQPTIFSHAHVAYTNLPFALFYGLAVVYFFLWLEDSKVRDLVIFSLLLAGSAWVRFSEPFHLLMAVFILLSIPVLKKPWWSLLSILPVFIVRKVWESHGTDLLNQATASISDQASTKGLMIVKIIENLAIPKITLVSTYFFTYVLNQYLLLLPALFLTVYLSFRYKWKAVLFAFVVLIGHFAFLYTGTFYYSLTMTYWQSIPGSLARLSMILLPMIYYLIFRGLVKLKVK